MQIKKRHPRIVIINFLLFFLTYIVHYCGAVSITIKNATPIILIPLLIAISMFCGQTNAAIVGLVVGICMDAVASKTVCFNAIILLLMAISVSLITQYLFNRNIRSAIALSIIFCFIYFFVKWIVFFAFSSSVENNTIYLLHYMLPSLLYTVVFIVPFYFLEKLLFKKIIA